MFYEDLKFSDEDRELIGQEDSQRIFSYWVEALGEKTGWKPEEISSLTKQSIGELGVKGKNFYFPSDSRFLETATVLTYRLSLIYLGRMKP